MQLDEKPASPQLVSTGLHFAVVVSRFNSLVTGKLLSGALEALESTGTRPDAVKVFPVPGSREIPLVARELARLAYDAVICLGAVIRGQTAHFEYVAEEASRGIAQAAMETGVPVIFGVLTCDTLEQALDRAGGKLGNKGAEAALAAVEMALLMKRLPHRG